MAKEIGLLFFTFPLLSTVLFQTLLCFCVTLELARIFSLRVYHKLVVVFVSFEFEISHKGRDGVDHHSLSCSSTALL